MEREHKSRTGAPLGGISPRREYASATLGEAGCLYIYGAVRVIEIQDNTCTDLNYDQEVSTIWVLESRERNFLGGRFRDRKQ